MRVSAAMLLLAGCASGPLPPDDRTLAAGTWGGENAGVIVSDATVHVHLGCTVGDFPGPVSLDAGGRFTAAGAYVLQAFPVQQGPRLPAQFSGRVRRGILTLAIAVQDTVAGRLVALGPVSVALGRTPELGPCPICARGRKE